MTHQGFTRRVVQLLVAATTLCLSALTHAEEGSLPAWPVSPNEQDNPAQKVLRSSRAAPPGSPNPLDALTHIPATPVFDETRPWAVGVTKEAQEKARMLFSEGTSFLLRSLEELAIKKYDEALRYWNHPGIHYNYAVALSTQQLPLATRRHLLEAVRFQEGGPLDRLELEQARRYLKLVEDSLAFVDVEVTQPGVAVSLDGQVLFTGPGKYQEFIVPDEHLVTATKAGYLPEQRRIAFLPGKPNRVRMTLYTEQELTRYRRRWSMWGPITLTTTSGIAAIAGGVLLKLAADEYAVYDKEFDAKCSEGCPQGSTQFNSLAPRKDEAARYNTIGVPLLIGGGLGVVAGAVLLYLNQSEAYRVSPSMPSVTGQLSITPIVTPNSAGLVGQTRF